MAYGPEGQLLFAWSGFSGLGDKKAANATLLIPVPETAGADLETLFDVLAGDDTNPGRYAASDLTGDGLVDASDLEAFPGADEERFGSLTESGKERIALRKESLRMASEIVEKERQAHARAMAKARARDPKLTALSDSAVPHRPPVRDASTVPLDPYGGDPSPFSGRADFGFLGITNTGWTPPDPHLAVGPNHIVVMTNGAIAFFDKTGTNLFQDEIEDSYGFWGALGATGFVFDPEVIYDPHSGRFMAMANERTQVSGSGSSYFLLAVSDDSDPNGTWHKYRINVTSEGGGGDIDSPNIAADSDYVYLSADFFTGGQKYLIYIIEKSDLLVGGTTLNTNHLLITGEQSHGLPVIYGQAPAMYLIEHFEVWSGNQTVRLHAITDPLGSLQHTTYSLTVPTYTPPEDAPQMGSSLRMETFDSRFWSCVYRNGSLWAAHHQGKNRVLARWYEIDMGNWPVSGTPALVQSGDIDPGSGVRTFFNSISVDDSGNALSCFARSSNSEYISVSRAYRLVSDTAGTMPSLEIVKNSSGPYTYYGRWGDYSAVGVDPSDNATFWYHHEYAPSQSSWNTWIASKTIAAPVLAADASTLSATLGGTITFSLNNPGHANMGYILVGSASGSSPGTALPPPPGGVVIPINSDSVTSYIFSHLNNSTFQDFRGTLDGSGQAAAILNAPPAPWLAGTTLDFAYAQRPGYWDFASNNVTIQVVP